MRAAAALVLALAACAPPGQGVQVPASGELVAPAAIGDTIPVAAVVADPGRYAGRESSIRGQCLGWRGPAAGSPPRTRSDWQLGGDGVAVWVSGPLPRGCGGTTGGGMVTVRGLVEVEAITLRSGQQGSRPVILVARR